MNTDFNTILYGLALGIVSYFIPLILSWFLLARRRIFSINVFIWVVVAASFHFIGGVCYWLIAITSGADSVSFFNWGDGVFRGTGTAFCTYMMWYLREWFLGDSLLGGFLFSSALGFLGQMFFFLCFINIVKKISHNTSENINNIIRLPAFIILFWPSAIFWSAGIAKDSGAFFAIGLFFYAITSLRDRRIQSTTLIVLALFFGYMIRPYLLMLILLALAYWILFSGSLKLWQKILIGLIVIIGFVFIAPEMAEVGKFEYSYEGIAQRAQYGLMAQDSGTSLGLEITTPQQIIYLLPFLMLANAYLPLFIYAGNMLGVLSSFENVILVAITIYFLKNRFFYSELRRKIPSLAFYLWFLVIGIFFLAMLNTNLGLSMRQKIMYIMPFLVVVGAVYVQKKLYFLEREGS